MKHFHMILVMMAALLMACGSEPQPTTWSLRGTESQVSAAGGTKVAATAEQLAAAPVFRMETRIVPGRLRAIFNDSNHVQLVAANQNGIKPITSLALAYRQNVPLVKMTTTNIYYVDSMRNAMPYLVPKAATLLRDIGQAFHDTIIARGGKDYRIRVTSMLRSEWSVSKLQRRNRVAVEQSCHLYGTTFDISWVKFDCLDPSYQISLESLKNILAEIIYNFREQGRCYAIFEGRQGCFHITVR